MSLPAPPTPERSEAALARLEGHIVTTPVRPWLPDTGGPTPPEDASLFLKLELFQRTGTFKARGALTNILSAPSGAVAHGVTAVSAGNHAIAVAYAARAVGTTARVVILESANPARVARCRSYGAEIEFAPDGASGFSRAREIEAEDGRLFIHPFEGEHTILGASTVAVELDRQLPDLDAVIVPCGGGGLLSGVAAVMKARRPDCAIYGVEPVGADSMYRSLDAGEPVSIDAVHTIADSLGAPHAAPYGFSIVQKFVDDVVRVDDDDMRVAMRVLLEDAKLVTEPASAAPYAAACGPLRDRLRGLRVALVLSGSNIDLDTFARHVSGEQST